MATSNGQTSSGDAPKGLTDLAGGSSKGALKRTVKAFKEDKLTDWTAALTYYGVLATFPALLVVVSVLGLIGDSVTDSLLKNWRTSLRGRRRRFSRTRFATRATSTAS